MSTEQKTQNQTIATLRGETQQFCLGIPLPDFETAPTEDWQAPAQTEGKTHTTTSLRRSAMTGLLRTWRRHTRGRLRRLLSTAS